MSFVYLLRSTNNSTYIGATVNLERRLRQHNKIIKGGAKATANKVNKGEEWNRECYIEGFPDWSSTLQFEWRWKQLSRKINTNIFPLKRRMIALKELLELNKPTSKAIPYSEYEKKPNIIFETLESKEIYNQLINRE